MQSKLPWRVLTNRGYFPFFASTLISSFGDYAGLMAVYLLLAYQWNATPIQIAILGVASSLPYVISSSVAGVLADRWDRRSLMIWSDVGRALIMFGLVFVDSIEIFYVWLAVKGVLAAIFDASRVAAIPSVVAENDLTAANGMDVFAQALMKVAGPAVGGAIAALAGARLAFGVDALSFIGSALALVFITPLKPEAAASQGTPHQEKRTFLADFRDGLRQVTQLPTLVIALIMTTATAFLLQMVDPQLPLLIRDTGAGDVKLVGVTLSAVGIGLATGSLLTDAAARWLTSSTVLVAGGSMLGLALLGLGGIGVGLGGPAGFLVSSFLAGFSLPFTFTTFRFVLQTQVPREKLGRVAGVSNSVIDGFTLAAPAVGGVLAQAWTVPMLFITGGSVMLLVAAIGAFQLKTIAIVRTTTTPK